MTVNTTNIPIDIIKHFGNINSGDNINTTNININTISNNTNADANINNVDINTDVNDIYIITNIDKDTNINIIDNIVDTNNIESKMNILKSYIKKYENESEQGSDEWLAARLKIIGGSEISTIMGCNVYSNIEDLIAQRIGLSKFEGNTATRWGNLFENVSELFFKTLYSTDVFSMGSIPHKTITNHRYSPDGLTLMPINNVNKITLLEFKSPYASVPSKTIPKHYLPQIKAGLCTIDISEVGLFINNMFRKCSLEQLNFDLTYDNIYHKDKENKTKDINGIIADSIILFKIPKDKIPIFMEKYTKLVTHNNSPDSDAKSECSYNSDSDSDNSYIRVPSIDNSFSDSDSELEIELENVDEIYQTHIIYKIKYIYNLISEHKEYSESIIKYKNLKNKLDRNKLKDSLTNELVTKIVSNLVDLGKETSDIFNSFLELYAPNNNAEKFIEIYCVKPQINKVVNTDDFSKAFIISDEISHVKQTEYLSNICKSYDFNKIINKFITNCVNKGDLPIGFLPWKLLRSSNILVEKTADYLNNIKPNIDNVIDVVSEIMTYDTLPERMKIFEKHYPNSNIIKKYYADLDDIASFKNMVSDLNF